MDETVFGLIHDLAPDLGATYREVIDVLLPLIDADFIDLSTGLEMELAEIRELYAGIGVYMKEKARLVRSHVR